MTREEQAFLESICADPGDLVARLVYCDWLEERGQDERSEAIRVGLRLRELEQEVGWVPSKEQIAAISCAEDVDILKGLVSCNNADRDCKISNLKQRGRQLIKIAARDDWSGFCAAGIRPQEGANINADWAGGFIERISYTCADWMEYGPQLVRLQPILEVKLTDKEPNTQDDSSFRFWPGRDGSVINERYLLWPVLFDLMYCDMRQTTHLSFLRPRREIADRLSWACVVWARGEHVPKPTERWFSGRSLDPECPDCNGCGNLRPGKPMKAVARTGRKVPTGILLNETICPNCFGLGRILPAVLDQQREKFNAASSR